MAEALSQANSNPNTTLAFLLGNGNYGVFNDPNHAARTTWVTWKGSSKQSVVFDSVYAYGVGKNLYLKFQEDA